MAETSRMRKLLVGGSLLVFAMIALVAWHGVRTYSAWQAVERVEFDTADARVEISAARPIVDDPPQGVPSLDSQYSALLAIGSDVDPEDPGRQDGIYADAVLLYLAPSDGMDPALVSIPRDLLVVNPCSGEEAKLNGLLQGCGRSVSGPELVALAVEDLTGLTVDHFALFDFGGFTNVIDAVGGVELCLPHALREGSTEIVPAGCSVVNGDSALVYVRSRTTQELIDGEWQFVEDVSDLHRGERQQQLLFALLARLKGMSSPATLASVMEGLQDTFTLSESLDISTAVDLGWDLRGRPSTSIRQLTIPTEPVVDDGSFALRATSSFPELIRSGS